MTADDEFHIKLLQKHWGDLTGEGSVHFIMTMLGSEQNIHPVSLNRGLQRTDIGKRRVDAHICALIDVFRQQPRKFLQISKSLKMIEIHLPVTADQRSANIRH